MKQIGSNLKGPSSNNILRGSKDEAPPPKSRKQTGSKRKQRAQGSVLPHLLSPLWGEYKEAQLRSTKIAPGVPPKKVY